MKKLGAVSIVILLVTGAYAVKAAESDASWTSDFGLDKSDLASQGRNPYFVLDPGYQLVLENGKDSLTITVLDETKMIDSVETRVVEERETAHGGKLAEVSRNYFAISKSNNGVFYFGEDTDTYDADGKVKHEGGWKAGENGAKAGLAMPGLPLLGARHYLEYAPKGAMDRAEILSLSEVFDCPAGKFEQVLKTEETTPLEPNEKEQKFYARGVGLLQDEGFKLAKYGVVKK